LSLQPSYDRAEQLATLHTSGAVLDRLIYWIFLCLTQGIHWHFFLVRKPNWIFVQVNIMTLYVKGYKIDRQKVADIVEARDRKDPLVDAGIRVVVNRLNRSAYMNIATGYEPLTPDGERHLALIVALEVGDDKDKLKNKELGTIDESIKVALPHALVGPDVWELCR
jgi:hypothetical protein